MTDRTSYGVLPWSTLPVEWNSASPYDRFSKFFAFLGAMFASFSWMKSSRSGHTGVSWVPELFSFVKNLGINLLKAKLNQIWQDVECLKSTIHMNFESISPKSFWNYQKMRKGRQASRVSEILTSRHLKILMPLFSLHRHRFLRKKLDEFSTDGTSGSCQHQCPIVLVHEAEGVHQLVHGHNQTVVEAARVQQEHLLSASHAKLAWAVWTWIRLGMQPALNGKQGCKAQGCESHI